MIKENEDEDSVKEYASKSTRNLVSSSITIDKSTSAEYRLFNKQSSLKKKYYYNIKHTSTDTVEITMKSGSKYYGQINSREDRNGYGKYVHIGGGAYEGYWLNGFKSGEGKFWNRNGVLNYEGLWECGEPHGEGKIYNNKGLLKYEGVIINGRTKNRVYWSDLCK